MTQKRSRVNGKIECDSAAAVKASRTAKLDTGLFAVDNAPSVDTAVEKNVSTSDACVEPDGDTHSARSIAIDDSDADSDTDIGDSEFDDCDPKLEFERKQDAISKVQGNQFFEPNGIHQDLKVLDQWIVAKNKIPQRLIGERLVNADCTNRDHWLSFVDAANIAVKFNCQIGFVFDNQNASPAVGIDIDHCIDADGNLNDTARQLVELFKRRSYIEKSTGGSGLHIVFLDTDAAPLCTRKNKIGVEFYSAKHFFVVTGNVFDSPSEHISAVSLYNTALRLIQKSDPFIVDDAFTLASDSDVEHYLDRFRSHIDAAPEQFERLDDKTIERIRKSKSASKFSKLFDRGDTSDYDGDDSRADSALLGILAFWCQSDPDMMERIFNRSRLGARDKWQQRQDYRRRSIAKVLLSNGKLKTQVLDDKSPFNEEAVVEEIKNAMQYNTRAGRLTPLPVAQNFELIFQNDLKVKNLIAFNIFAQKVAPSRMPAWRKPFERDLPWQDRDDDALQNYIDRTYNLRSKEVYYRIVSEYARDLAFHPIQDFFRSLPKWDGKLRAERLFIDNLGADDSPYTRCVTIKWLLAAVSRAFHPACKFDYALVLKGKQGIGKSTMLSLLGGKWFGELDSILGKDAIENLQGKWLVELVEMQSIKRADNEQIKSFLSRQVDSVRLPWGRRTENFPRRCVFAATTNEHETLRDQTGGRRLWYVECRNDSFGVSLTADEALQVWAEVYRLYQELFADAFDSAKLDLPADIKKVAVEKQEENTDGSDLRGQITAFLNLPIPKFKFWKLLTREERRKYFTGGGVIFLPLKRLPRSMQSDFERNVKDVNGTKTIIIDRHGLTEDGWDTFFGLERDGKRERVSPVEVLYECFEGERSKLTTRRIADIMRKIDGWQEKIGAVNDPIYGRQKVSFIRVDESHE